MKFWKTRSTSDRSRERSWKSKSGCQTPILIPPVSVDRRLRETEA